MSVHPDRGAWVVRWRQDGRQRSRRFGTEPEALAFEEGLLGGSGKPRSSTPYVYPYETRGGMRWRYSYRDSRGRASSKRGFASERAAARDRERTVARVRDRGVYVSRLTFGEFLPDWLRRRKPYVAAGTWTDYEIHGRKRLLPHFGERSLTAITTLEVRDWLLELHESGEWAPKTLNNALGVLVAALNGAAADRLIALNPAAGVERLPLGHIERDWLRLHEIGPYLDACTPVYRPLAELLIGSGTRISEALALRWDDVDFERRVLRVYRSDKRDGEGSTKGKRFRSVQVGPGLLDTLRDLRARHAAEAGDLTRARVHDAGQDPQARTRPVALKAGPRPDGPQHRLDQLAQAGARGRRAARHAAPLVAPHRGRRLASDGPPAHLCAAPARPRLDERQRSPSTGTSRRASSRARRRRPRRRSARPQEVRAPSTELRWSAAQVLASAVSTG